MSSVTDSDEPRPKEGLTPTIAEGGSAPVPATGEPTATATPRAWAWACVVAASLVAGFLAWAIGEQTQGTFRLSAEALRDRYNFTVLNREQAAINQANAALAFGTLGAVLGLVFGTVGGGLRRSVIVGAGAALMGLLLGGVGGALTSYGLVPIYSRFYSDEVPSLVLTILVRGGIWAVVGMTSGLALGWGWRGFVGIPGTMIGGLAGGFFGTIAFEVVNALMFPDERNDAVIPSSVRRDCWLTC